MKSAATWVKDESLDNSDELPEPQDLASDSISVVVTFFERK
jgi:hypothetical protein